MRLALCILALLCGITTLMGAPRQAFSFDEFDTLYAPPRFALHYRDLTLEIKGRARLGLHDLQGDGGPGYDSPTDTATIGTRSPFVELDSFDLALRLNWLETVWFNTNISFLTDSTSLSAIYFEYRDEINDWYSHGIELGYLSPVVATDRHTARYPLIAIDYWKNPEYHAAYAAKFAFTDDIALSLYASASFMRPLRQEPIHGSPTYAGSYTTLSYGSAKPYSGNSESGTFMLRFQAFGFGADAFATIGKIVNAKGLETLYSAYPYYRSLDDFNNDKSEATVWWAGGRLQYNGYGVHLLAEAIASEEQLIRRAGLYTQGSYTFYRDSDFFNELELLVRYEQTWTLNSTKVSALNTSLRTPEVSNAISWDHQIVTLAARLRILYDILSLRVEYSFFMEQNNTPKLDMHNLSIDDNELLIQLEARY